MLQESILGIEAWFDCLFFDLIEGENVVEDECVTSSEHECQFMFSLRDAMNRLGDRVKQDKQVQLLVSI